MYAQSDTLLLADVFNIFRNMCLEIYELDTAHFFSAPRINMASSLKKAKVKEDLLTDIDLLLTVENILEVEFVMLFINMQKLIA